MRILNLFILAGISVTLASCSTLNTTHPTNDHAQNLKQKTSANKKCRKNPMTVSFYQTTESLNIPYTIIGNETISKYNTVGIKRQQATIHDAMRTLAASMGGDAIVNIRHDENTVSGTVIAYQSKFDV